jgi:hypothetical protein
MAVGYRDGHLVVGGKRIGFHPLLTITGKPGHRRDRHPVTQRTWVPVSFVTTQAGSPERRLAA